MKKLNRSRVIVLALAAVLLLGLTACSASQPAPPAAVPETTVPETLPETTAAPETQSPAVENTSIPEEPAQYQSRLWENNILCEEPLEVFGIEKEDITSVTFLDSLDRAPEKPWNVGAGASARVKGWVEYEGSKMHLFYAAEGGINGSDLCEELFMDCTELVEVNFNGAFHTDYAESMKNMFYGCEKLKYVNLEGISTANVQTMYQMFRGCKELKELDVSGFDTAKVESMYAMFSVCMKLRELDLSNFDTSRVENLGCMFSGCQDLEWVDVSGFDTSRVWNMENVFAWCDMLMTPDLSGWDVSRVQNHSRFMDPGMRINGQPWEDFFE